jgi:acetylornithine deacetylase/succinyl-diaminopimelate desuccinylase-like protein
VRIELLKQILAVPTCSRHEDRMVEFITRHVRQGGAGLRGTCASDDWNNVYIRKGQAEFCPCVAAHIDTVHYPQPVRIVQQGGMLVGLDRHGQRTGIGADDKAGVFICLELLERFDDIAVALFAAEEIGCMGAYHAPAKWFDNVGCVIEFDCPARGLLSYTAGGVRMFQNDGDFIQRALPVLNRHGLTRWQRQPFTDVMALRKRFDVSCLNLSCGYHNWHQTDEYVVLDEVKAALASGEDLVRALGCRRYAFDADDGDSAPPLLEVTGLQLA